MKKNIITLTFVFALALGMTSCLKSNDLYTDYGSTQPVADLPKASNLSLKTPALVASLDSVLAPGTVDLLTAVHISAKDHIGDVTIKLGVDNVAATALIARVPAPGQTDYRTYQILPASLITVPTTSATIPNAGVFSVGNFIVKIQTGSMSKAAFNAQKYLLAISITDGGGYTIASNFQTIYYRS